MANAPQIPDEAETRARMPYSCESRNPESNAAPYRPGLLLSQEHNRGAIDVVFGECDR